LVVPIVARLSDPITPSLRDGSLLNGIPGNKLPGYDHLVPPGQTRLRPYVTRMRKRGTMTDKTSRPN
jgi:hypothetical protein